MRSYDYFDELMVTMVQELVHKSIQNDAKVLNIVNRILTIAFPLTFANCFSYTCPIFSFHFDWTRTCSVSTTKMATVDSKRPNLQTVSPASESRCDADALR